MNIVNTKPAQMNLKFILVWLLLLLFATACSSTIIEDENLLESLMMREADKFAEIVANKDAYEVQIIYTQINRDENNQPSFKSFYFNVDPDRYFYPASTVKFPASVLALEKLNRLGVEGLDKYTAMLHDSSFSGQTSVRYDSTAENYLPSVAHYIKKIMLVSDNDAHNRLYEFLGQGPFNDELHKRGLTRTRMTHRLAIFLSEEENRHTNPVHFVKDGALVLQQEAQYNDKPFNFPGTILRGKAYMRRDTLVNEPFDFTTKNNFPLSEQQQLLKAIFFPDAVQPAERFDLSEDDYKFLYQYMSQLPRQTNYPDYTSDPEKYDAYAKFLMYGSEQRATIPEHIKIFNKIGQAYGYLTDNAYIIDFENNIEFMLSATLLANRNQTFNDGTYDYEAMGLPFMKDLGEAIYNYELKRVRKYPADLSAFKIKYD